MSKFSMSSRSSELHQLLMKYMSSGENSEELRSELRNSTVAGTLTGITGITAIHWAARNNQTDIMVYLLKDLSQEQRGQILKLQDNVGNTALHDAANKSHLKALSLLLTAVSPDEMAQLLSIKNKYDKTVEMIKDLPQLSSGYARWNSLELKDAKQRIMELEGRVKQLEINDSKRVAELESCQQKSDNLQKQVEQQEKELRSLSAASIRVLEMLKEMDEFNRRCFTTDDTGDQEHESEFLSEITKSSISTGDTKTSISIGDTKTSISIGDTKTSISIGDTKVLSM
ncbi:uncharacterized protein [Watersipora subatra]|uniref:uncharacterized protein isoform X2 n=1 Tax=Watersipora subatra TaxID=2589382 RepID=UPI00355B86A1